MTTNKERIRELERDVDDIVARYTDLKESVEKMSKLLTLALATITELQAAQLDADTRIKANRTSIGPIEEALPVQIVD